MGQLHVSGEFDALMERIDGITGKRTSPPDGLQQ